MGRNKQHRRHRPAEPRRRLPLEDVLLAACRFAYGESADTYRLADVVDGLAQYADNEPSLFDAASSLLDRFVSTLLDSGWQPADLAHVVRQQWSLRVGRLAVAAIAAHSRATDALTRAPQDWLDQLEDLGVFQPAAGQLIGGHGAVAVRWARSERLHFDEAITGVLQLLGQLIRLPRLSMLLDPPSRWPDSNRGAIAPRPDRSAVDPKMLTRIRALLAKAEASTFEEEADAFSAKAQELMTKFSIDSAFLAATADSDHAGRAGVVSRRIHIEKPYADEKATFLAEVARANDCRAIWADHIAISTVMGFPIDTGLVEVLYTSLLVQATRASEAATRANPRLRTPSYRRAFLLAYAYRIGERLQDTRRTTSDAAAAQYGSSLEIVLTAKTRHVDDAFEEAFPNARAMPGRRLNAEGYHAGRAAADRAQIAHGQELPRG